MNKKGLIIGKILSTLPVFLLIVFITGIFLILTAFAVVIKKPIVPALIEGVWVDSVLVRDINIEINNKNNKMLVFDALVKYWNEEIDIISVEDGLEEIVDRDAKESHCLAIAQGLEKGPAGLLGGASLNDFFIGFKDGNVFKRSTGDKPLALGEYEKEGLLREISFSNLKETGKIVYIQYYYGKCLEERQ